MASPRKEPKAPAVSSGPDVREGVATDRGDLVARVVPPHVGPPHAHAASACGFLRGTVLAHDDLVAPDFDAWSDLG